MNKNNLFSESSHLYGYFCNYLCYNTQSKNGAVYYEQVEPPAFSGSY